MNARSIPLSLIATLVLASACAGTRSAKTAAVAPAPAVPTRFAYAPSTGQYRIAATSKSSQEVMGQKQEMQITTNRLVTVALARTAPDTLSMAIVVDSFTMTNSMGVTPPGMDKLIGSKFSAKLSPFGAFYSAEGPKESDVPNAGQFTNEMGRILPRINAVLAPGAAWTDTVSDKITQGGLDLTRTVISRFSVAGDTTIGSEKAWKIVRQSTTSVSGSGAPGGQSVTVETTGTAKGTILISRQGVLIGGESEEQSTGKAVVAASGMEVGITAVNTATFQKVK